MAASSSIPDTLTALRVPISGLTPYGENPRRGNVDVIAQSLRHHGQYRPIVVRAKTFEVLAGNHTLAAAQSLGWTEIAATFIDVTDDQAARIVLVDNRSADLGSYEDSVLLDLLTTLREDLDGTGYTEADLAALASIETTLAPLPDGFPEYDDNIETQYECPSCGYEWSGSPMPGNAAHKVEA